MDTTRCANWGCSVRRQLLKTLRFSSAQRLKDCRIALVGEAPYVSRIPTRNSYISDLHRAVLDAAHRPRLVGGAEVLAEAVATAAPNLKSDILIDYASRLGYAAALRRLGSLADTLRLHPLAGALEPIKRITADLDIEPGSSEPVALRDKRWRVRWPRTVDELQAIVSQ